MFHRFTLCLALCLLACILTFSSKSQCISNDTIVNQITTGNFSICGIIPCETLPYSEGVHDTFYSTTGCRKIASVRDSIDGINLGNVTVCETIDCSLQYYNGHPFLNRHFEVTPTTNGKAYLCFYILQMDINDYNAGLFPGTPLNPTTNLTITQVDGGVIGTPGSIAITIPNSAISATYNAATTVWSICFPVDSFSNFYIHSPFPTNIALPAHLLNFTSQISNQQIEIDWETTDETNIRYFELELSHDGKNFNTLLSRIDGKANDGNYTQSINYHHSHLTPNNGYNYYRLKLVDLDGNYNYSDIISAYYDNSNQIRIYPIPVKNNLTIELKTSKPIATTIEIFNIIGSRVQQQELNLEKGQQSIDINTSNLPSGLYFISIRNNDNLSHFQYFNKE
jgi:hypothetical protein